MPNYSKKSLFGAFGLAALIVLAFQNCSDVGFSDQSNASTGFNPIVENDTGVEGGHFDLDTAVEVYADGDGDTTKHQHEYDDRYNTNVADFFDLIDDDFDEVDEVIPQDQSFYIRVANADLSPRVGLEINGVLHNISTVQHGPFTLSGVSGTQMNGFRAIVATDAIRNLGLVSSQPRCVIDNDFSADGRYRNGALVIQAIRAEQIGMIDAVLNVAASNEALLWEAMIFWHEPRGDCR